LPSEVCPVLFNSVVFFHDVLQSALWGFCGADKQLGNPYRTIQVDGLHQSLLGVFKILVNIVRVADGSVKLVRHPLRELDRRLQVLKQTYRYASHWIPGNRESGYFTSNANYHAFEHKAIMQVVPFCLLGVISDSVIGVFIDFIDWYILAFHSKEHSDEYLEEMDRLMRKSVRSMKKHAKHFQKSGFDLVKIHAMAHILHQAMRCSI
jgi:hypothetical protein